GTGVSGKEEMFVGREGEGVGLGAGVNGGDETTVVDAVDADEVGPEVSDPEAGVVAGDDAVNGFRSDHVGSEDLIVRGVDLGDGVGGEVGDEDLATVGLEGEVDWGAADVEHGEQAVGDGGGILTGGPGVGGSG